jgi:F0F1-type ATP synthase membrane subunit b/b'
MKAGLAIASALAVVLACAHAYAAAPGAEHHPFDFVSFLFFVINFAIFVAILVYFGRPYVRGFARDRAASIRDTMNRAQTAFDEAEDFARRARERIAALDDELARLAADLAAETAFQVRQLAENAEAAAARVRRDAEQASAALAELAQRRLRERLALSSAALARRLIAQSFEPSDQARLLDRFMERLGREAAP